MVRFKNYNEEINWNFIKSLNKLQEKEGFHLGNKLKSLLVNYENQKMKVKLASQLFSQSVANAIEYCDEHLSLPQFKNSAATTNF